MSRNDAPTRLEYRASKGERGAGVSHSPRACPCGQLSERTNTGSGRGRAAQQKTFRAPPTRRLAGETTEYFWREQGVRRRRRQGPRLPEAGARVPPALAQPGPKGAAEVTEHVHMEVPTAPELRARLRG